MTKPAKLYSIIGSSLLVLMALFHGSGYSYVQETITVSNAETFLKDIVPVLFIHPTIHLLGLSAFGLLTLFLNEDSKKVLNLLSVLIMIDALLAFYLTAYVPGVFLASAAACFLGASLKVRSLKSRNN